MFRSEQGVIPGSEPQNYDDIRRKQKDFSQCRDQKNDQGQKELNKKRKVIEIGERELKIKRIKKVPLFSGDDCYTVRKG
jgi:hypothetical protein